MVGWGGNRGLRLRLLDSPILCWILAFGLQRDCLRVTPAFVLQWYILLSSLFGRKALPYVLQSVSNTCLLSQLMRLEQLGSCHFSMFFWWVAYGNPQYMLQRLAVAGFPKQTKKKLVQGASNGGGTEMSSSVNLSVCKSINMDFSVYE